MQAYLLISLLYKKDSLPMLQREDTSEANFDQKLSEICIWKSWPSFQTDIQKMKFYGFPSSHQCRGLTREQNQCQKNSLFWLKIKPKQNSFGYKTKICLERKFIDNFCLLVLCKHQPKITSINCCYCIP